MSTLNMTTILEDRVDLYKRFKARLDEETAKTREEVWEEHLISTDLLRVKVDQQRERLEQLGIKIG